MAPVKKKLRSMRLLVDTPTRSLFTIPRNISTGENKIPANNMTAELVAKVFEVAAAEAVAVVIAGAADAATCCCCRCWC